MDIFSKCMWIILFVLAVQSTVAEIYKWIDENGNIHYGDKPQGKNVEQLKVKSEPSQKGIRDQPVNKTAPKSILSEEDRVKLRKASSNHSMVIKAIKKGDLKEVKQLIETGLHLHYHREFFSPLMIASHYGRLEIMEYLIAYGFDVNYKVRYSTALTNAIAAKQEAAIELLLKHGVNVDIGGYLNNAVLHRAVKKGDITKINYWLEAGANIDAIGEHGSTPLIMAIKAKGMPVVKMLLEKGANPNAGKAQQSALEKAIYYGYKDIVAVLIKAGADTTNIDYKKMGMTPEQALRKAAYNGDLMQVKVILKNYEHIDLNNTDVLASAARGNHVELMKYLINRGADINGGEYGKRPVSYAMGPKSLDALKFLLDKGADFDFENTETKSIFVAPLIGPIYYGKLEVIRLLIQYGADVNKIDIRGNTPLRQALTYTQDNKVEIIKLLLDSGADPELKNKYGISPRLYAMGMNNEEIKKLLKVDKASKPYPIVVSNFTYNLDTIDSDVIMKLLNVPEKSIFQARAKSGLMYYEGMRVNGPLSCKYEKNFVNMRHHEFNIIIAVCGAGPYDQYHMAETIPMMGGIYSSIFRQEESNKKKDTSFISNVNKFTISNNKQGYAYLMPLVGHGILFVPMAVIIDNENNTSLVVQLGSDKKYFDKIVDDRPITSDIQRFITALYEHIHAELE